MENLEILEILTQKTDIKFELSNNLIYPKEDSVPLDKEIIEYILSENFDLEYFFNTYAMPKTSFNHKKIVMQLTYLIANHLNLSEYAFYVENVEVKIKSLGSFRIPDLCITILNQENFDQKTYLTNPISVIEVLSPSTAEKDKNQKKEEYQAIESLQEYILIAQDSYKIEQFLRKDKTNWIVKIYDSQDQTCILTVGVKIKLKDLYKNTDWAK